MPLDRGYIGTLHARDQIGRVVVPGILIRQNWDAVAAKDTDGFVEIHTGASSASTRDVAIDGDLQGVSPVARSVLVTVTHASSVVAMSGTIYGTDQYGTEISEAWSVTATGTSKTYETALAFKTVSRFVETVAADASANSIIVGQGDRLGLDYYNEVASAVKEIVAGSVVTNGTVTKRSAGNRGTYSPNSAPSGGAYELWYIAQHFHFVK